MLFAHLELRELLAGGVLEDDDGGGCVRDAGGGLSGLEFLQLEKFVEDFLAVGRIAVKGVHGPARLAAGEREGLRAGDFHAGDVRDVEGGEDLVPDDVGGLLRTAAFQPKRRADECRGGEQENDDFLHGVFFLCD